MAGSKAPFYISFQCFIFPSVILYITVFCNEHALLLSLGEERYFKTAQLSCFLDFFEVWGRSLQGQPFHEPVSPEGPATGLGSPAVSVHDAAPVSSPEGESHDVSVQKSTEASARIM